MALSTVASKSFRQASVAVQPGEGAFDHPTPGQQDKALGGVRPLDDLDGPFAELFEGALQLVTGVGGIGEDMAQPGKGAANALQQVWRAITVLYVSWMNNHPDRQADRV